MRSDFTGTWVSTSATGHTIVAGTTIELTFTGDTIAAYAGCNRMSGNFTLDGDRLVVGPLATTRMGCEPDRQAQDDWVGGLLGAGPTYDLAGTALTLRNGADSLTLERQTP